MKITGYLGKHGKSIIGRKALYSKVARNVTHHMRDISDKDAVDMGYNLAKSVDEFLATIPEPTREKPKQGMLCTITIKDSK